MAAKAQPAKPTLAATPHIQPFQTHLQRVQYPRMPWYSKIKGKGKGSKQCPCALDLVKVRAVLAAIGHKTVW